MYAEASYPRVTGDKAILHSPSFKAEGACTMTFWYNMWGDRAMGDLNLHVVNATGTYKVGHSIIPLGLFIQCSSTCFSF